MNTNTPAAPAPANGNAYTTPPKKKNHALLIIVAVLFIISIIGGFLIFRSLTNTNDATKAPSTEASTYVEPDFPACTEGSERFTATGDLKNESGSNVIAHTLTLTEPQMLSKIIGTHQEGHPDQGCTVGPSNDNGTFPCDQDQRNEGFKISVNGVEVGTVQDKGEGFDDDWFPFEITLQNDIELQAGDNTFTFTHIGGQGIGSVKYKTSFCYASAANPTPIVTASPAPTRTATPSPTRTASPAPTATNPPVGGPSSTPIASPTTVAATATPTAAPTSTPAPTAGPTNPPTQVADTTSNPTNPPTQVANAEKLPTAGIESYTGYLILVGLLSLISATALLKKKRY